jgi:hypothetical protein
VSVTALKDEILLCRTIGHAWDPIPYDGERREHYALGRSARILQFRCTRCHTSKYVGWSKVTGDALFSDYVYEEPEEYKLSKEDGARTNMRSEFLRRWDPKKSEAPHLRVVRNNTTRRRRGAA